MKFMLMMHAPRRMDRRPGSWQLAAGRHQGAHRVHDGLQQGAEKAGELVGAEGLARPGSGRVVRAGKNGAPESPTARSPKRRSSSPATGSSTSRARSAPTRSPRERRRRPGRAARR